MPKLHLVAVLVAADLLELGQESLLIEDLLETELNGGALPRRVRHARLELLSTTYVHMINQLDEWMDRSNSYRHKKHTAGCDRFGVRH